MQEKQPKWRHEYKYYSPEFVMTEIEKRISVLLKKDPNTGVQGFYHIRSIYFDDIYNTCYFENEDGTDEREKFRIRTYNNSDSRISLELKRKKRGKCQKLSCRLSKERLDAILKNSDEKNILAPKPDDSYIYKKFYSQISFRKLEPVNIVCYDRFPYIHKNGNVRITFDRNIRGGDDFSKFFMKELPVRPILPVSYNILEVKFDEFLPDYIYNTLQEGVLKQTSFSKYYLCRKYNMKSTL